jgi:hypothetical protein
MLSMLFYLNIGILFYKKNHKKFLLGKVYNCGRKEKGEKRKSGASELVPFKY